MTAALVIGAGPAGLAAAARLAEWCDRVEVVEARPRERLRHAGEHLPPAGLGVMARLGLGALVEDPRHAESSGITALWSDDRPAERDYFAALPGRGVTLCRPVFDAALARHAELAGAVLHFETPLLELGHGPRGYIARLGRPSGRRELRADLLVDASGRRAAAALALGARRRRLDRLVGIAGRLAGPVGPQDEGRLLIEALADGWWYATGLPDGTRLATFMTDAPVLRAHPGGARALWRARLGDSRLMGAHLAGARPAGLEVFDAATQILEGMESETAIAVGDAALAFDPLSSWGIAKGLADGDAAARALERARRGHADAPADHRAGRAAEFARYLADRSAAYAAGRRWPNAPFWRARMAPDGAGTSPMETAG